MRYSISSLVFGTLVFSTHTYAQSNSEPDYKGLSEIVSGIYDCQLIKPMLEQTANSPTRVGNILAGIYQNKVSDRTVYLRILQTEEYCTPTTPIPGSLGSWAPKNWEYTKQAGFALNATISSFFNLGSIKADYVKSINVTVADPKIYPAGGADERSAAAGSIKARPLCAPAIKATPTKPNVINKPQMITFVCTGKPTFKFVFDRGVDISALNLQISAIKLGLSFSLHETLGTEVACGASAKPAAQPSTTGGTSDSTAKPTAESQAAANVIQAIADAAKKQAGEALAKAKLLASQALGLTDPETKTAATTAAAKAQADANDAKKKADNAQQQADAAKAAPAPTASGKCYSGVTLESNTPLVMGIVTTDAQRYLRTK